MDEYSTFHHTIPTYLSCPGRYVGSLLYGYGMLQSPVTIFFCPGLRSPLGSYCDICHALEVHQQAHTMGDASVYDTNLRFL
jgi:hypothetical protein